METVREKSGIFLSGGLVATLTYGRVFLLLCWMFFMRTQELSNQNIYIKFVKCIPHLYWTKTRAVAIQDYNIPLVLFDTKVHVQNTPFPVDNIFSFFFCLLYPLIQMWWVVILYLLLSVCPSLCTLFPIHSMSKN